jgi:hypothetical protein
VFVRATCFEAVDVRILSERVRLKMKRQKKIQVKNQVKKKGPQQCGPPSTFALVKFTDESYFIANNNQVKIIQEDRCVVKYKGANYDALLLQTSGK